MKKTFPPLAVWGLAVGLFIAVTGRGAVLRIYWCPVAVLMAFIFTVFITGVATGKIRPAFNKSTDVPLLLLLFWAGISTVFSINREKSFYEVSMLAVLICCYFLAAYSSREQRWKTRLLWVVTTIATLEAAYALTAFFLGKQFLVIPLAELRPIEEAVTGTYGNKNHLAGLMEMSSLAGLGAVIAIYSTKGPAFDKIARMALAAIPPTIMVIALVLSLSRGGWISVTCGIILLASFMTFRRRSNALMGLVVLSIMATLIVLIISGLNSEPLSERMDELEEVYQKPGEISMSARISLSKSALAMAMARPVTGFGPGTFKSAYPSFRRDNILKGAKYAHNDYLQLAAEIGFPGLALFLLFLAGLFRTGTRVMASKSGSYMTRAMPGIVAGMMALLLHETVDFNLMIPANAMVFFILAGLVAGSGEDR